VELAIELLVTSLVDPTEQLSSLIGRQVCEQRSEELS
jgi:hypothetical protein